MCRVLVTAVVSVRLSVRLYVRLSVRLSVRHESCPLQTKPPQMSTIGRQCEYVCVSVLRHYFCLFYDCLLIHR